MDAELDSDPVKIRNIVKTILSRGKYLQFRIRWIATEMEIFERVIMKKNIIFKKYDKILDLLRISSCQNYFNKLHKISRDNFVICRNSEVNVLESFLCVCECME